MATQRPGRKRTPAYLFFYLLFAPDTWRLLLGLLLARLALPYLAPAALPGVSRALIFVMLAAIGWVLAAVPGRGIARFLQHRITG